MPLILDQRNPERKRRENVGVKEKEREKENREVKTDSRIRAKGDEEEGKRRNWRERRKGGWLSNEEGRRNR